jgi:flagellar biosynthesis protein FlhA
MALEKASRNWSALALPVGAISIVFVMLIPIPGFVLDMLLAVSISASVLVFLTAIRIRKAVDLSVFPTLLLLLTLFRLALNIASSRRILLHGHEGTHAAGSVIEAFGQFVVGGNYVVGFVLFLALTAIQFLVIAHGAVRTAEVTARFTLDALPGKQMAIDADMNAGLIDERGARKRREAIAREAEFYGSMDGAARFSQRDAMATILITAINIVAGLLIGVLQQGVDLSTAVKTYTILTVGDGLVTMVPSLLVSIAGGLVLTRAASSGQLDKELSAQILRKRTTLWIACGVMCAMALVPGLPRLTFLLMACAIALFARTLPAETQPEVEEELSPKAAKEVATQAAKAGADDLAPLLRLDELTLEIGFQLIPMVDEKLGGQMLNRVRALRRHLAMELGFIVPPVHITDNLRLKPREYVISLRGSEIARWQTEGNCLLAVNADPRARALPGTDTREPAFGVNAKWIEPGLEDQALASGYSVVDQTTVIATHLGELIRKHAHELLGRNETKRLLDSMSETHPKLVEELVPKVMSLGEVQKVLQQLLREGVSIRDMGVILETLLEAANSSKAVVHLVESCRQALGRGLVRRLLDSDGGLRVMTMQPALEQEIVGTFDPAAAQRMLAPVSGMPGDGLKRLVDSVKSLTGGSGVSATPVLLCPSPARYHLRRWLEPMLPKVTVLAAQEIPPDIRVRSMGALG